MKNARVNIIEIEVNGIKYIQTRPNYYYKFENGHKRISKSEWEQAWDAYIAQVDEADEEFDAEDEIRARKEAEEQKDREAEAKVNGKAKKATKKRAPRNKNLAAKITFEGKEIGITEKQKDFMLHLTDTDFWEQGVDSSIWVDCLCEQIGGQFENKPMTVGAMISTLREKGLVNVGRDLDRKGHPKFMVLTDAGKAMAQEIGLN